MDTDSGVPGVWSYTVFNDELWGSSQYIFQVFVLLAAPSTVTGSPEAWVADTDNVSYVVWTNAEISPPYPHDIAPGTSLAGFQISSPNAISVTSIAAAQGWDHLADAPGLSSDAILVDAPFATPEPRWAFLAPLLLAVWTYRRRKAAGWS